MGWAPAELATRCMMSLLMGTPLDSRETSQRGLPGDGAELRWGLSRRMSRSGQMAPPLWASVPPPKPESVVEPVGFCALLWLNKFQGPSVDSES